MKEIYILLTRSDTSLSRIVHLVTGDRYTHASLIFDLDLRTAVSFTRDHKHWILPAGINEEELLDRYGQGADTPCALYRLSVTDEAYFAVRKEVQDMLDRSEEYGFNIAGLILCRLGIPFTRRHHFFCSHFVGDVLERAGAIKLTKDPSVMRPRDYQDHPQLNCFYEGPMGEFLAGCHLIAQALENDAADKTDRADDHSGQFILDPYKFGIPSGWDPRTN